MKVFYFATLFKKNNKNLTKYRIGHFSDYSNFCPFKISDVTENGDIVCCCNHQHFCNYNVSSHTTNLTLI